MLTSRPDWASLSKPRTSRLPRVFGSAVLSECVTLAFGAGPEKAMAARAIRKCLPGNGNNKGLYHLVILSASIRYATLSGLEITRPGVTKPLRREHNFRMSSERAFPTRGELWEKGSGEFIQAGLALSTSPTLGNLQRKWPLAAGTALEEEPPAHAWPTSNLDRTSARRNQAGAFAGFR